jgi:hypothetical protein
MISFTIQHVLKFVVNSGTEAELRDHVIWLQLRDVIKITVYRANNFDSSISTYIKSRLF